MSDLEQELDIKSWELPYVEDKRQADTGKTNALNKRSDWKYEPPEPEPEIVPPTAEEIEAIRKAAHEEGYAEGRQQGLAQGLQEGREQGLCEGHEQGQADGYKEGYASGQQQIELELTSWQQLVEQMQNPVAQVEQQLQQELVRLAVILARSVVGCELVTNQDMIFQALSEGLKVLPVQQNSYQIHLNPDDLKLVKQHFSAEDIAKHHWQLIEAPQLSRGGCDITTDANAVDYTLERRARDVLDKFLLEQGLAQIAQPSE